ncbi:hypothetical protein Tco_0598203 [Tanacetum coccineum]
MYVIRISFESNFRRLKNARFRSLYTSNCGCSKGSLEDKILVPKPPRNCVRFGQVWNPVMSVLSRIPFTKEFMDGIFCRQCTCKSCGKGAHYGYNCPPKVPPRVPIISNPEPCKNQTIDEPLQNLQSLQQQCLFRTCQQCGCNEYDGVCFYCKVGNGTQINVSTPYSSNDSPSVANHPPQPQYVPYSRELCGNDSHYGYDCPPQVPFVYNQDLCFNQNFDYFPQTSPSFPQQYLCCENCGGPHETYQCQPMNEDYYHEQNSCYDSNSFGFDQVQPPQYTVNHPIFNSQNDLLNSQNKLMEQMTTLRDLVGQAIQKKEEEKRIAEEQAAKDRSWKIPICYDDDEDNTIAITPVLPIEEPDNSLSMGDEHLDTIPATESDEVIKSSVENLIPIPSEPEGIPDSMCDVPLCNNPTSLNTLNEHSEIVVNSNDDNSSSDDDSTYGLNLLPSPPPPTTTIPPPPQPSQPSTSTPPTTSSIPSTSHTEPKPEPDIEHTYPTPSPQQSPQPSHATGSLSIEDLCQLVPQLMERIDHLEKDLKDTKQTFGTTILTLVKKVKDLETALKRKSKKDDESLYSPTRETSKPSGEAQEKDLSPTILEAAQILSKVASQKPEPKGIKKYIRRKALPGKIKFEEVSTAFEVSTGIDIGVSTGEVNTGGQNVNTGSISVSTASAPVNTGSISVSTASVLVSTGVETVSTDSTRVSTLSPPRSRREGKAPMTAEDEPAPKKTKIQILQEEASLAEAFRLQQVDDEERAKQIYLDSLYS